MKKYTSVNCFTGSSEDNETQVSFGISNTKGKPMMSIIMSNNVQSTPNVKNIKINSGRIVVNKNTIAQLENMLTYVKQAWEQCSGEEYVEIANELNDTLFKVHFNESIVKE